MLALKSSAGDTFDNHSPASLPQVMAGTPLRGQNILGNTLERVRASLRNARPNGQASSGMASLTFVSGSKVGILAVSISVDIADM